jgi:hypothetical protein
MKIVVKECDKYHSQLNSDKEVSEYLVYLMTDDNKSVECQVVVGEEEKKRVISEYQIWESIKDRLHGESDRINSISEVSFEDFRSTIIRNNPTYNG